MMDYVDKREDCIFDGSEVVSFQVVSAEDANRMLSIGYRASDY
jgi:hypothetical protein